MNAVMQIVKYGTILYHGGKAIKSASELLLWTWSSSKSLRHRLFRKKQKERKRKRKKKHKRTARVEDSKDVVYIDLQESSSEDSEDSI